MNKTSAEINGYKLNKIMATVSPQLNQNITAIHANKHHPYIENEDFIVVVLTNNNTNVEVSVDKSYFDNFILQYISNDSKLKEKIKSGFRKKK